MPRENRAKKNERNLTPRTILSLVNESVRQNTPLVRIDNASSWEKLNSTEFKAKLMLRHGIDMPQNESLSKDDVMNLVSLVEHPSFWPKHAPIHPNFNRVKKWLWVHSRYREALQSILDTKNARKAQNAYRKLEKKLSNHSRFENEQLFRFFEEHVVLSVSASDSMEGNGILENLQVLRQNHSYVEFEDIGRMDLKGEDNSWDCRIRKFADDLLQHMELEEQVFVRIWLNLSTSQYRTYRSYLSWKYAVMY